MSPSLVDDAFRQLVQRIDPGSTLLRAWPLTGGISAQVTALEIQCPDGTTEKWVARLHGPNDLKSNPHIARDEFRLLRIAQAHGIAAPKPVYLDESCGLFPTPIVVIGFVEGTMIDDAGDVENIEKHVMRMAEQLALIHRVPDSPDLSFLPRFSQPVLDRPETLDDSLNEGRIRDALESVGTLAKLNPSVLLHGDYWPGNLLWVGDEIAAVIDWEDAEVGDPLSDLGNSRLEILWTFGADAMRTFTSHYVALTGIDPANLPYWDLYAALHPCGTMSDWGLSPADEASTRDLHGWFVEQALVRL